MKIEHGSPFSAVAAGTSLATATQAGAAGQTHYVTGFSGGGNVNGTRVFLLDGSTVKWRLVAGTNTTASMNFDPPIKMTLDGACSVQVGSSTNIAWANINGFTL